MRQTLAVAALFSSFLVGQAPDNTRQNRQDRNPASRETTPQNATATKTDVQTLRDIRKAITSDKDLSTYAHNVKITVKNGQTTLRGPVRSEAEKTRIEELAKENGAVSVSNELQIAPSKSDRNAADRDASRKRQ